MEEAEKVRAKDERRRERALEREQKKKGNKSKVTEKKGNKSKVTATKDSTKVKTKVKQVPSQPQKPVPDLRCFLLPSPTRRSPCLRQSMFGMF